MDITELLAHSVRQGASDLHLSAGLAPMLRVDGEVWPLDWPVLAPAQVANLLSPLLNQYQQKDFETSLETDFAFELPGVARFRVNVFQQARGMGAVFRTLAAEVQSLEALGLGEVFQRIAQLPRGLVLVTGPTGSGKSTTLAAMIDYLNQHRRQHILTLEDPIEFIHTPKMALINQRHIDPLQLQGVLDGEQSPLAPLPRKIMGAWYLGVVGNGEAARCVAYETALNAMAVADVLQPPTYAYGAYGSWSNKPN